MPITRSTLGLITRENFDGVAIGAVPAGWTRVDEGGNATFSVETAPTGLSGRALRGTSSTTGDTSFQKDDTALLEEGVVQAVVLGQGTLGEENIQPTLVGPYSGGYSRFSKAMYWQGGEGVVVNGGAGAVTTTHDLVPGTVYKLRAKFKGTAAEARLYSSADALLATVSTSYTLLAGKWGLAHIAVAGNTTWFDDWCLYKDTVVTISGLPTGHKARVSGQVAVESGGTAALDFTGLFPQTTLEVLDAADAVVESLSPVDGVWGGDVYAYEVTNTAPGAPTVTSPAAQAYDASITVAWNAATDAEGNALQYEGEWWNGSIWQTLFPLQAGLNYVWDTSGLAEQGGYQVRVRAWDGALYGDYGLSALFSIDHPSAPTVPVVTAPAAGSVFDTEAVVSWGVSTDAEGDPVSYEGEWWNGASWLSLFPLQSGTQYVWNTTDLADRTDYKVRVRSFDGALYSAYGESGVFSIAHAVVEDTGKFVNSTRDARLDAVTFEYLTMYAPGPIAVGDVSQGTSSYTWRIRRQGNAIQLARETDARTGWNDEVTLFYINDGAALPTEVDLCFDELGQPVVALERAGRVWIIRNGVLRNLTEGVSPRCGIRLGDAVVVFASLTLDAIVFRSSADDFVAESLTPIVAVENKRVEQVVWYDENTYIVYSSHDVALGRYDVIVWRMSDAYVDYQLQETAGATIASDSSGNGFNTTIGPGVTAIGAMGPSTADLAYSIASGEATGIGASEAFGAGQLAPIIHTNFTVAMVVNPSVTTGIPTVLGTVVGSGRSMIDVINSFICYPEHGDNIIGGTGAEAGVGIAIGTNGVVVGEHSTGHTPSRVIYEGDMTGWHKVVVVFKGDPSITGNVRVYIDGVDAANLGGGFREGSSVKTKPFLRGPILAVSDIIDWISTFQGLVSQFTVWDRALSLDEIAAAGGAAIDSLIAERPLPVVRTGKYYEDVISRSSGVPSVLSLDKFGNTDAVLSTRSRTFTVDMTQRRTADVLLVDRIE